MPQSCSSCAADLHVEAKFCPACGLLVSPDISQSQSSSRSANEEMFCRRCKHQLPRNICGSPQSPYYNRKVGPTDHCSAFLANPAQDHYIAALRVLFSSEEGTKQASEELLQAIQLGLPHDDEMMARSFLAGAYSDIAKELPTESELIFWEMALDQIEASVAIDKLGQYGYFLEQVNRARLGRFDVLYALTGMKVLERQGTDAAIAYLQSRLNLYDHLSTNPMLESFMQLGKLCVQAGALTQGRQCFERVLRAEPVGLGADELGREADTKNLAAHILTELEPAERASAAPRKTNRSALVVFAIGACVVLLAAISTIVGIIALTSQRNRNNASAIRLGVPQSNSPQPTNITRDQQDGGSRSALPMAGTVATCSSVKGWRDYTSQKQFRPGENLCVYAEALNVQQHGQIDVQFRVKIIEPAGATIATDSSHFSRRSSDASCYFYWSRLPLSSAAQAGPYTAEVELHNNLTGQAVHASTTFIVVASSIENSASSEQLNPQAAERPNEQQGYEERTTGIVGPQAPILRALNEKRPMIGEQCDNRFCSGSRYPVKVYFESFNAQTGTVSGRLDYPTENETARFTGNLSSSTLRFRVTDWFKANDGRLSDGTCTVPLIPSRGILEARCISLGNRVEFALRFSPN